ncbi:MAG: indolepyruvate ferredoxin oxidoreductase subunit alpha [Thermoproteus sp.]|jgi:NAD-dependent dihydropyrimidine dehydrogenase PreA subunit
MIEFVVRGEELGDLAALGISYGLSITFRRALAVGRFDKEWIAAILETGVWGALLLSPCPDGLPCFRDLEEAVRFSESRQMPVGYDGEEPAAAPYRVSTFNKNYLKPRRWIRCREISRDKAYLPLFACLYNLLKLRADVPIVVSDVCLEFGDAERPDFQVLPTYISPRTLADVVDVSVQPIPASAIARGILLGGYKAGPVVAISKGADSAAVELGGYLVDLDASGNPCELFSRGVVGYSPSLFSGRYVVDPDLCDRCGDCFITNCDALRQGERGVPELLSSCVGCGACALMCTRGAIRREGDLFKVFLR